MPSKIVIDRTTLFIKRYGKDIVAAIVDTGLYFEAVIGQKCNESGYGDSNLAKTANNLGGIRGKPQEAIGKTSTGWAIFATPKDCFKCYARFLNTPRYIKAGVFTATSPEEQIKRMVKAGYCELDANVPTVESYLKRCQGAIDATRMVCPIGKVSDIYFATNQVSSTKAT
jgi:flagellum-specific peptidoglycan hydrolase FlgJ